MGNLDGASNDDPSTSDERADSSATTNGKVNRRASRKSLERSRGSGRTWWDRYLKFLIIITVGTESLEIETYPETELGKFPPRVDLIVKVRDLDSLRAYDGPLSFLVHQFKEITFIEFKSPMDAVTAGIFKRLAGHFGHYADQQGLSWSQWLSNFCGIAMVSHHASLILRDWKNSGVSYFKVQESVYLVTNPWKFVLVDLENIPITNDTAPLVLLAPRQRGKDALQQLFKQPRLRKYLEVAFWLYPKEVRALSQSLQVSVEPDVKTAVEILGIKRVIEEVGLARVIEEVGLARVIEEVGLVQLLRRVASSPELQELVLKDPSLSTEEREKLKELLDLMKR